MNETSEIVNIEAPANVDDALEIIERRAALFDKMRAVAIRSTNSSDWSDQGGKPYLENSGCTKVGRRFGVAMSNVVRNREDLEDDNGKYYFYITCGRVSLNEREYVDVVGTATSRDDLYSRGGKLKMKDIDIGNIIKKSYTNCFGRGVRQLLGMTGLTWEELKTFGIERGKAGKVDYNSKGNAAAGSNASQKAEADARAPYWKSEFNGKAYLMVRAGEAFSQSWLESLGFKVGKTPGVLFQTYREALEQDLAAELHSHEQLGKKEVANG